MYQLKDREGHGGLKNKAQLYVVYKKPNLNIKTHRLKVNGCEANNNIICL